MSDNLCNCERCSDVDVKIKLSPEKAGKLYMQYLEKREKIADIKLAIQDYYNALDRHDHGEVAQRKAFNAIEGILGMGWGG